MKSTMFVCLFGVFVWYLCVVFFFCMFVVFVVLSLSGGDECIGLD